MNIKSKAVQGVLLVALAIAFISYYFSLYTGNEPDISNSTTLILIFACSNFALFTKEKMQNRFLDVLAKLDCLLLVIWSITLIVQLVTT